MKVKQTSRGTPYTCQSKGSYVALELVGLAVGIFAGSGISAGRRYRVAARVPYTGKLALVCKSKVDFRLNETQIYDKSPGLQKALLHSYMDLKQDSNTALSDLRLEKALLPALCAIEDAYPEICVTPGQSITIHIAKETRWDIPEEIVDSLYPRLIQVANRLLDALAKLESAPA